MVCKPAMVMLQEGNRRQDNEGVWALCPAGVYGATVRLSKAGIQNDGEDFGGYGVT